jgi:heptosyltransferase-2
VRAERVLVSLKTYLGDAVMASPALGALELEFEQVCLHTSPPVETLLQDPIRSRMFLPYRPNRAPWSLLREASAMRKHRFDVAILVNRSFRAALTAALAGIPIRVGHRTEGRGLLLTHPVRVRPDQFEAESIMDLARVVDCDGPARPSLEATLAEQAEGAQLLAGATVGVQPGARYDAKQIPPAVTLAVIRQLRRQGIRVALLGGEEERALSEEVARAAPPETVNLVGKCSLRQSVGVLSQLQLCIGADTGLMHIAAAVGCPTVTVFGPTSAKKWGHRYEPHVVLEAEGGDLQWIKPQDLLAAVQSISLR